MKKKRLSADLRILLGLVASLLVGGGAGMAAPEGPPGPGATLAPGALDLQARDLFRAQRYTEALAIYQRLHAETHHPTYLRNIGRCYQMTLQPAPAIDAFRGYLRDARDLDPAERREIEGYIAEMQRLELSAAPPASPAPAPSLGAAAVPVTAPAAIDPAATGGASQTSSAGVVTASGSDAPSLTRRWWFWTAIGAGVVAATTGVLIATSGSDRLPCPSDAVCR